MKYSICSFPHSGLVDRGCSNATWTKMCADLRNHVNVATQHTHVSEGRHATHATANSPYLSLQSDPFEPHSERFSSRYIACRNKRIQTIFNM